MRNEKTNSSELEESPKSRNRLGQMIRMGREKKEIFQSDLAKKLGIKASAISNYEKGQRLPSLAQLAQLSVLLDLDLQTLVLSRTYDEICSDTPSNWPENTLAQRNGLLGNMERYIQEASSTASAKKLREILEGRSFLDFPRAFYPMRVVTGDVRQDPPKTAGDIGAYSACPIDDRWIYKLGLLKDTEKVSDKEFVISDKERLERKYGHCNLLVIGSPATNHLARIVNANAIFRFNLPKELKVKMKKVLEGLPGEKDREVLERRKRDNLTDLKQLMRRFCASYGIIDPVLQDVRGFALAPDMDYAVVTFAVNPYYKGDDFRYVAVTVAGFHHPGTVWALRCLGEPHNSEHGFLKHPFGGVLEIKISPEIEWEERMPKARCSWDTAPYNKEDLIRGMDELKSRRLSLLEIDSDELEKCKRLLLSL